MNKYTSDYFSKRALEENHPTRSYYKLEEIDKKFYINLFSKKNLNHSGFLLSYILDECSEKEEIIGNSRASRLMSRPYRQPWILPTV